MTKQADFTKDFEREAVRLAETIAVVLAETSGRTRKEIAADVGIGLSTLTRWLARRRDALMHDSVHDNANEDMAIDLKRLRLENDILCQERDILKKATAFFAKEGSQ